VCGVSGFAACPAPLKKRLPFFEAPIKQTAVSAKAEADGGRFKGVKKEKGEKREKEKGVFYREREGGPPGTDVASRNRPRYVASGLSLSATL
jgi:hypothetical protein